jgi:hypothetical protein
MIKKSIIIALVVILAGAVSVGAYDAYQGNSTLDLPDVNLLQGNAGGQGRQQGQRQGQQGQRQGQQGQNGRQNGSGNGTGIPQEHEWVTLTGSVISDSPQGLLVDTAEQGELTLNLGKPGFAEEQAVVFNPGDTVTILGFDQSGVFQVGQITNNTTDETLFLRDPNGRPLWAGRGGQGGSN